VKTLPTIALKRLANASQGVLEGVAALYDVLDRQNDMLLPGAFDESIEAFDAGELVLPLLLDHALAIGSITGLRDSPGGLIVTAQLALGTDEAARVFELAKAGTVPLSPAFTMDDGDYTIQPDGVRVISRASLFEISAVSVGAIPGAGTTSVKRLATAGGEWRDLEEFLRARCNLSARGARRFVSVGRKSLLEELRPDDQTAIAEAILAAAQTLKTLE
jgi:HK97 family phage prohead protease